METKNSEARLMQDCYMWFHNTYPHMRGLYFQIKNESTSKITGARAKATGVVPGVSDACLLIPHKSPTFIEFKTETGKQSKVQAEWESLITISGYHYVIIHSLSQFQNLCKLLDL